jgi:hypothetical protein
MTPPKFGAPGQYVKVTRQGQRCKQRMREPEKMDEIEDVTMSDIESINPTWVEKETLIAPQWEVGKSCRT